MSVRCPGYSNATPVFPLVGSDARSVDENSPPGTNVGKPVKANDTGGDRLHYTLTEARNCLKSTRPPARSRWPLEQTPNAGG